MHYSITLSRKKYLDVNLNNSYYLCGLSHLLLKEILISIKLYYE
jgi:hypothetical protein